MLFSRGHAAYLYQLPVVLALKLGITNSGSAQAGFRRGLFLCLAVGDVALSPAGAGTFLAGDAGAGAAYLNAAFVAVGEHVVAHAFFWPVVFVLLFVRPLTRSRPRSCWPRPLFCSAVMNP